MMINQIASQMTTNAYNARKEKKALQVEWAHKDILALKASVALLAQLVQEVPVLQAL